MDFMGTAVGFAISLFAIAPIVYVVVGVNFWRLRPPKSVNYFSLFMFAVALYSFGYFLEIRAVNESFAFFTRNFQYLGSVFTPTFGLLFIAQNTGTVHPTRRLTAGLCAASGALWLLYVTDPFTGFFYRNIVFSVERYGGTMLTEKNIGFYILFVYYALMLAGSILMICCAMRRATTHSKRNSYLFLLIVFQIPWFTFGYILFGYDTYLDLTPLTLMVMSSLFVVNELFNDMFERHKISWQNSYASSKSPGFLAETGGTPVAENKAGKPLLEAFAGTPSGFFALLDDAEAHHKPVMLEKDGAPTWYDVRKNPFNTKGTLINYALSDITAEKATSIMAELFFDSIDDFVTIFRKDGRILFVNAQARNGLGYSEREFRRMSVFDFLPEQYHARARQLIKASSDYVNTSFRFPLIKSNGDTVPVELRTWEGDWNGEPVLFAMARDVTLFQETQDKFQKSFYNSPAVMAITDLKTGQYLDVNDAFTEKLGYKKEEVIGKSGTELGLFVNLEQRKKAMAALTKEGEFRNAEVVVRSKSGREFIGMFSGSLLRSSDADSLLTVMIDVTEERKKDSLLRIITAATQDFLRSTNYMEPVQTAFGHLGSLLDVSRIFLFRTVLDDQKRVLAIKPLSEWCSKDTEPQIANPGLQEISEENARPYIAPLANKKHHSTLVKNLEESFVKMALTGLGVQSVLTMPVFDGDVFWGLVCLQENRYERQWTPLETTILNLFVDSFTMALQRFRNTERIEFLSYHDPLTGMYNRRYYEQSVKRLDNEKYLPLTLVMVDVNGLKLTNDAFGHGAGDELLRRIAGILSRECRAQDIVARIGGDEFVLLLPRTDAPNADRIVERINSAIALEKIENLVLSASLGFAVKSEPTEDIYDVFRMAEDEMYRNKLSESSSVRSKTIDLILHSLFEKNVREMHHSDRVGEYSEKLAKALKYSKGEISRIRLAGLMHDIGKIGISEALIDKPDILLPAERAELRRHAEIGYRILGSVSEFSKIADYVLEHHERWDGMGYPKGLKGEEISLPGRIIALADSYDAMTSDRRYRAPRSNREAAKEIMDCAGTQFDPALARVFVEKVLDEGDILD